MIRFLLLFILFMGIVLGFGYLLLLAPSEQTNKLRLGNVKLRLGNVKPIARLRLGNVTQKMGNVTQKMGIVKPIARLCLVGPAYGRTFNQITTVGHALRIARPNEIVYLNKQMTSWLAPFFDFSQSKRVQSWDGPRICTRSISPIDSFYSFGRNAIDGYTPELNIENLPFKEDLYQKALAAIDKYTHGTGIFISVHQRWMEGQCVIRSKRHLCPFISDEEAKIESLKPQPKSKYAYTCNYTKSSVLELLPKELIDETIPLVLFTDSQLQSMEQEYAPHIDYHSFEVQVVMMTLSTYHVANPMSSVDHVVAGFRGGKRISPSECFNFISERRLQLPEGVK